MSLGLIQSMHSLLPQYDCGVCHNPECIVFIRRFAAGLQPLSDCPYISQETQEKLIPYKNSIAPPIQDAKQPSMTTVQPCTVEGMYMLEVILPKMVGSPFPLYDTDEMCATVRGLTVLDKIQCSKKLGYSSAQWNTRRLHIFNNGKLNIRNAPTEVDVLKVYQIMKKALLPALITKCGCTIADIMMGFCRHIPESIRNVLNWSGLEDASLVHPTVDDIWDSFKHIVRTSGQEIKGYAWNYFDSAMREMTVCLEDIRESYEKIRNALIGAGRANIYNIVSANTKQDALAHGILQGFRRNAERTLDALVKVPWGVDSTIQWKAREIFEGAYVGFRDLDLETLKATQTDFIEFKSKWENTSRNPYIYKIAYAGNAIASLPVV